MRVVSWAEKAIAANPEGRGAHRADVAALGIAGLPAQAAVARLLELDPQFNVADYTRHTSSSLQRAPKRVSVPLEDMRRAGVPARRDHAQ